MFREHPTFQYWEPCSNLGPSVCGQLIREEILPTTRERFISRSWQEKGNLKETKYWNPLKAEVQGG